MSAYLPGFLRPEREGALHLHSLGRPGGHLWPYVDGASLLSWDFIDFPYKPMNISLFSYLQHSLLIYLSLNQSPTPSTLRSPWILRGWTPAIIQIWWGASSYISVHSRSNQCSAASGTYREGRIRTCIQTWGGRFTFSADIRANVKAVITIDTEETSAHIWSMIPHHYLNSDPISPQ